MAVGCGAKCAKAMLIVFNIIFWLSGCALLGVGIWLRVDKNILDILQLTQINSQDQMLDYASYLIIGVGAFVFLVGFLGCCGAIKENKCCLGLYIFFLLIVMAAELAAGILILLYKDQILGEVTTGLKKELEENNYVSEADGNIQYTAVGASMNMAQQQFKCCGISGFGDYQNSNYSSQAAGISDLEFKEFPFTCCKMKQDTDLTKLPSMENVENKDECIAKKDEYLYKQGCEKGLTDFLSEKTLILIGIGIGIACLEVFGLIFSICLCRNLGDVE